MKSNKRKRIIQALNECGLKNETVLVETPTPGYPDKAHIELRNYFKMTVKFLETLPENVMESELDILRYKAKNGGLEK